MSHLLMIIVNTILLARYSEELKKMIEIFHKIIIGKIDQR